MMNSIMRKAFGARSYKRKASIFTCLLFLFTHMRAPPYNAVGAQKSRSEKYIGAIAKSFFGIVCHKKSEATYNNNR